MAAKVRRTRRAARMEDYADSPGAIAELIRDKGVHSAVGAPIVVAGGALGSDDHALAPRARAAGRHRGADGAVRRATRHGDRKRGQPRAADSLSSASRHRGGPGTAARGARPPRRRTAAAGPCDRDAEAGSACGRSVLTSAAKRRTARLQCAGSCPGMGILGRVWARAHRGCASVSIADSTRNASGFRVESR